MNKVEHATIQSVEERLRRFVNERGWQRFQTPKNLTMALAAECGELLEQFQWLDQDESRALAPDKRRAVAEEVADVFIYLLRLADELGLDIVQEAWDKMAANEAKYPPASCQDRAPKA